MEEKILEEDPKPYKIVKTFFMSCMDTGSIEVNFSPKGDSRELLHQALGLSPLKSRLEAIGGWPLIDSGAWKDEEFTWYDVYEQLAYFRLPY